MISPSRTTRALETAVFVLAIAFAAAFLLVALLRIGYPYELEWIEGGSLAMVERLRAGLPLYVAPSLRYVPFNYPPLYYVVAAPLFGPLGGGFTALRLVSFASSLACAALLFAWIRSETRDARAGLLAGGLFLAAFRFAGAWMDTAHADSLALALLLAALLVLRRDAHDVRAGLVAGGLAALSFFAKQTAAVAVVPVLAVLLVTRRRRGLAFGLSAGMLAAAVAWLADARTGGWFRYYVFGLAGHYAPDPARLLRFVSGEYLAPFGIATVGGCFAAWTLREEDGAAAAAGGRAVTFAAALGLVLSSAAVRAYPAAYDNVLMPACAGAALLFGLGWHAASTAARAGAGAFSRAPAVVAAAALIQFGVLLYDPVAQVPTAADRGEGDQLVENLRQAPGAVLVPCHDYLVVRAGKGPQFHEMSLAAVTLSGNDSTATRLSGQLLTALAEHRWSTVLLDNNDWLWDEVSRDYEARMPVFQSQGPFRTRTGMIRRPEMSFAPRTEPRTP